MKFALVFCLLLSTSVFAAEAKMKLNVVNEDITKLLQDYSKASGQSFIIDSTVRNARSAQRDNIQVSDTLPKPKPNRMMTWVISLKYASVKS